MTIMCIWDQKEDRFNVNHDLQLNKQINKDDPGGKQSAHNLSQFQGHGENK